MQRALAILLATLLAPTLALGACPDDTRALPARGVATCLEFPLWNSDGSALLTGATGLDSECGGDGTTPTDCTAEAVETGGGWYSLALTASETDYRRVLVTIRASGIPPLPLSFETDAIAEVYEEPVADHSGVAGSGAAAWAAASSAGDPWATVYGNDILYPPGTYGYFWHKWIVIATSAGTVTSAVPGTGEIRIRRGIDYSGAAGTASVISYADGADVWASFIGATVTFHAKSGSAHLPGSPFAVTVTDANTLTLTLTDTQTLAIPAGSYRYFWRVALAGGLIVDVAAGPFVVETP